MRVWAPGRRFVVVLAVLVLKLRRVFFENFFFLNKGSLLVFFCFDQLFQFGMPYNVFSENERWANGLKWSGKFSKF